ncbi:NADH-quinone oxidoreductase subunit J [Lichenicoccus sp.]|uniref:NADH-quinone oxidoreductase subunit J n=1 Tax=Lichenicoccus sp. TaxID=2781899 RepID=UPI003D12FDA4
MILTQIAFYVFATVLVLSAAMVVSARNPVHSVLFLILAFFNAAGLFLIAGAEFLAMILVIVYVGAVAVLFLFVVMMLDIDFSPTREGFQRYAPIGLTLGAVLLAEIGLAVGHWRIAPNVRALPHAHVVGAVSNTAALGRLIYTDYVFLFQACGLVLLVAMIGAIVLTHRDRPVAKRQDLAKQHARVPADTIEMMTLGLGQNTDENGGFLRSKDVVRKGTEA